MGRGSTSSHLEFMFVNIIDFMKKELIYKALEEMASKKDEWVPGGLAIDADIIDRVKYIIDNCTDEELEHWGVSPFVNGTVFMKYKNEKHHVSVVNIGKTTFGGFIKNTDTVTNAWREKVVTKEELLDTFKGISNILKGMNESKYTLRQIYGDRNCYKHVETGEEYMYVFGGNSPEAILCGKCRIKITVTGIRSGVVFYTVEGHIEKEFWTALNSPMCAFLEPVNIPEEEIRQMTCTNAEKILDCFEKWKDRKENI